MAASQYNWALNTNSIQTALRNMIISQQVYDNLIETDYNSLVDRARAEGSLYGDTMLKYSVNTYETYPFDPDSSDQLNVLQTYRPAAPKVQAITIDVWRWLAVTTDRFLSKQAFMEESAFSQYMAVVISVLRETKNLYDTTTYNTFVGTEETSAGAQQQVADLSGITAVTTTADEEAYNRLTAEYIAEAVSNIFVALRDPGTDFNDWGFYRSRVPSDMIVVWNADWVNRIKKVDLPAIFHKDGLLEIKEEDILPAKYFGSVNSGAKVADASTRSLIEQTLNGVHYWPGETIATGVTAPAGTSYQQTPGVGSNNSIICKIMHKDSIPYMSGFETETEFINPKNRSENHYYHFGHNTLVHLGEFPLITVKAKMS